MSYLEQPIPTYKVVLYGNEHSGKRSLINSMMNQNNRIASFGVSYCHHRLTVDERQINLEIWNLNVSKEGRHHTEDLPFRTNHAVLHCFDVANRESFNGINGQLERTAKHLTDRSIKYIVGTKSDLPDRKVARKEGESLALAKSFKYLETSNEGAKNQKFLVDLAREIMQKNPESLRPEVPKEPEAFQAQNEFFFELQKHLVLRRRIKVGAVAFAGVAALAAAGVLFAIGANAIRSRLGIHGYWLGALALAASVGLFVLANKGRQVRIQVYDPV